MIDRFELKLFQTHLTTFNTRTLSENIIPILIYSKLDIYLPNEW